MIDIRDIVAEIVKAKDASDKAAFTRHVHGLVRDYGQNLLLHLSQAVAPATPDEIALVGWLQARLADVARQIPEPTKEG